MKLKKNTIFSFLSIILCSISLIILNPVTTKAEENTPLQINAKKAVVLDLDTKEVLYSFNAEEKSQIASTTKLLTALILSENKNKNDELVFSELAKEQESTSVYKDKLPSLAVGDKITADNVMKGLLLSSGNDMAIMIAESISGNIENFSKVMNSKAASLGMENSFFYTPNGLDSDTILKGNNHYSTAYDMALLGIACYNDNWVREAISLKDYTFSTTNGKTAKLTNTNKNLGTNYCIAGKTGYTTKAGRCLVAIYEKDGHKLVGVILGGDYTGIFDDMNKLMDYSFNLKKETILPKNQELSKIKIKFKPLKFFGKTCTYEIPVFSKDDITDYNNDFNEKYRTINVNKNSFNSWDLNSSTVVGKVKIQDKSFTENYNLYTNITTKDLINYSKSFYIHTILIFIAIIIFIVFLLFMIRYINLKKRRNLKKKNIKSNKKSSKSGN